MGSCECRECGEPQPEEAASEAPSPAQPADEDINPTDTFVQWQTDQSQRQNAEKVQSIFLRYELPAQAEELAKAVTGAIAPQFWGISEFQLEDLEARVLSAVETQAICNVKDPDSFEYTQWRFDHFGPNMYQVNQQLIQPVTAAHPILPMCSWALMLNGLAGGLEIDLFVSHAWAEGAKEFCRNLRKQWPRHCRSAYVCFLSNPQNGGLINEMLAKVETSPFYYILESGVKRLIILSNGNLSVPSRLWCVFESFMAVSKQIPTVIAGTYLFLHPERVDELRQFEQSLLSGSEIVPSSAGARAELAPQQLTHEDVLAQMVAKVNSFEKYDDRKYQSIHGKNVPNEEYFKGLRCEDATCGSQQDTDMINHFIEKTASEQALSLDGMRQKIDEMMKRLIMMDTDVTKKLISEFGHDLDQAAMKCGNNVLLQALAGAAEFVARVKQFMQCYENSDFSTVKMQRLASVLCDRSTVDPDGQVVTDALMPLDEFGLRGMTIQALLAGLDPLDPAHRKRVKQIMQSPERGMLLTEAKDELSKVELQQLNSQLQRVMGHLGDESMDFYLRDWSSSAVLAAKRGIQDEEDSVPAPTTIGWDRECTAEQFTFVDPSTITISKVEWVPSAVANTGLSGGSHTVVFSGSAVSCKKKDYNAREGWASCTVGFLLASDLSSLRGGQNLAATTSRKCYTLESQIEGQDRREDHKFFTKFPEKVQCIQMRVDDTSGNASVYFSLDGQVCNGGKACFEFEGLVGPVYPAAIVSCCSNRPKLNIAMQR